MIYLLNYKGRSLISQGIKAVTWSKYSHTAMSDDTGRTLEAWHIGGLKDSPSPWTIHTPRTPVMVYSLDIDEATAKFIWRQMLKLKGSKYDFRALLGFVPLLRLLWKDDDKAWFCSHATAFACKRGAYQLFSSQTPLYKVSPGLTDTSAKLKALQLVYNLEEYLELMSILNSTQ